ncbi:hypothetical protein [Streptomyces sp. AK04-3B]|uniref:hypothetical protein n=2 Tax=unclassified Streptomyces TaxID=2593676 RepID=UPI0029BB430C|nr:hypothetical protein [Streptomyces sp. AK04-3B]MDX3801371.1 hypothetical protein [Streptomyces sp. AK04-3B]
MKMRKLASLAMTPLVLAGIAVAAPIAGATAASAVPSVCQFAEDQISPVPIWGSVICYSGTGQYRVKVTCKDGITGNILTSYGPWVGIRKTSKASCGNGSRYAVTDIFYQDR